MTIESFDEWEKRVTNFISEALNITYSDASGMVEAECFVMSQQWTKGNDAIYCGMKIISRSNF